MTSRSKSRIAILAAALLGFTPLLSKAADAPTTKPTATPSDWPETKEHKDARMKWFREAKFGMFVHWGTYSVPAGTYDDKQIKGIGEWIQSHGKIPVGIYEKYAAQMTADKFDAEKWMQMVEDAGVKYVVI